LLGFAAPLADFPPRLRCSGHPSATGCHAKHGQSPINPLQTNKVGHFADLVATLPDAATNPAALAIAKAGACATGPCGFVMDDDVALIWLEDQTQAPAVAAYLNDNANALAGCHLPGGA
jgi:hypothetical protein